MTAAQSRAELLQALEALPAERRALLSRELARAVAAGGPAVRRIPRGEGPGRIPASSGQERLYYLHNVAPDSPSYLMPILVRLRGPLDQAALTGALRALVARHEILRTGFEPDPGSGLVQVIYPPDDARPDISVGEATATELHGRAEELLRRPFDLARPPLLRAGIWRVHGAADDWLLALCLHHIVVDGWSLGLLTRDLGECYAALAGGRAARLTQAPLQYADYAVWQRDQAASGALAVHLRYWQDALAGAPETGLTAIRPATAGQAFAGSSVPVRVPPELASALQDLAEPERATLFMVLLAGAAVTFGRWAGQSDLVIGTPVAGRGLAELEDIVGFFVNTLPLRIQIPPGASFRTLLRHVRDICLAGYAHQDAPFERIVQATEAGRHGRRSALVQVMLALNNTPAPALRLAGVTAEVVDVPTAGAHADVSVELTPAAGGGLAGWLVFSAAVLDRWSAERMSESLTALLAEAAAGPDRPLAALALTTGGQRRHILTDLGCAQTPAGPLRLVHDRFAAQAEATPDAPAVVADEPAPGEQGALTYRELSDASGRLAAWLRRAGIGPEDRVGVLQDGPSLLVSLLGVLRAGAVYVPLDPALPDARLAAIVGSAAPRLILSRGELAERRLPCRLVRTDLIAAELSQCPARSPAVAVHPDNACCLLYTSGSSGAPKGVVGTHRALAHRVAGLTAELGFGPADVVLAKTPVSFDPSLWEMLVPLGAGACVVTAAPGRQAEAGYLADVIARHKVTSSDFVPAVLTALLAEPDITARAASLRRILCGGDRLTAGLAGDCAGLLPGAALYNLYGPTETMIEVSLGRVTAGQGDPVSIGRPVPGTELFVLAHGGEPQPAGAPGELYVGGLQLARGYTGPARLTAERFVPSPFRRGERLYRTGDRVRWREDGGLDFLGRVDDQVKIRGQRIEPAEVTAALRSHPAVRDAVVLPRLDGAAVCLTGYVTTATGASPPEPRELRRFLHDLLPAAMIPAEWVLLDEMPLLPSGKLDRARLRGRAAAAPRRADSGDRPAGPAGPVEEVLAGLWAEVLDTEIHSVHDDFFELGGHSLLATMVLSRIQLLFRFEVPLPLFIEAPTIADSAVVLGEQGMRHGIDAEAVARLILEVAAMSPQDITERLAP